MPSGAVRDMVSILMGGKAFGRDLRLPLGQYTKSGHYPYRGRDEHGNSRNGAADFAPASVRRPRCDGRSLR